MNWTKEAAEQAQDRVNRLATSPNGQHTFTRKETESGTEITMVAPARPQTPLRKMQALGRMPGRKMNKTEAAYARLLETQKYIGEILWWAFEPINIRLADNTFYKVDFLVLLADMTLQAHETKGHWTDDALVKFKVAANILPFPFKAIRMVKGSFETILEK